MTFVCLNQFQFANSETKKQFISHQMDLLIFNHQLALFCTLTEVVVVVVFPVSALVLRTCGFY